MKISLIILVILIAAFLISDYSAKYSKGEKETAYVVEIGHGLSKMGQGIVSATKSGAHHVAVAFSSIAEKTGDFFENLFAKETVLEEPEESPSRLDNVSFDFTDNGEMLEEESGDGNHTQVINEGMTIVTNSSGVRYLAFTPGNDSSGLDIVRYLVIPAESSGISFRPMQDLVYATSETELYLDAGMKNSSTFPVYKGKCFTRTGISSEGIYQLVDSNKQIVYAMGSFFGRFKEDTDYDEEILLGNKRVDIEMKLILQNPELPNGCEVTSLAMVLDYLGYRVDKCVLSDDYMPKAPVGQANFYEEYVGNPREQSGLGCYAPVIVATANNFLQTRKSNFCARDYTGSSFYEVINQLDSGNPVIVWISSYMDTEPRLTTKWLVNGESLTWKSNLHCVVVSGYDGESQKIITYDPLYGKTEYDLDLFVKRFKQYYSQIVVVNYK